MTINRYDMFPHMEECLNMTLREWLYFHNVMHRHYTHYMGRKVLKSPFDWIVTRDLVYDTRPEVIVEIGCYEGGFTLWLAHLLDAMQSDATIIGIDRADTPLAVTHPRITWVTDDCLAPAALDRVTALCAGRRGMVIEDSDHKYLVTKAILDAYARHVAVGSYFVVEDTCVEFLQLPPFPGPLKAVKEFVEERQGAFVIDRSREKYVMTYNPMGYLLRVAE